MLAINCNKGCLPLAGGVPPATLAFEFNQSKQVNHFHRDARLTPFVSFLFFFVNLSPTPLQQIKIQCFYFSTVYIKSSILTVFGPIPLNCESSLFTSSTDSSRRYSRQILPLRSLTPLSIARILAAFVAARPPHRMASSSRFPSSSTTSRTKQIRTEKSSKRWII
jgi:hypothetical protein